MMTKIGSVQRSGNADRYSQNQCSTAQYARDTLELRPRYARVRKRPSALLGDGRRLLFRFAQTARRRRRGRGPKRAANAHGAKVTAKENVCFMASNIGRETPADNAASRAQHPKSGQQCSPVLWSTPHTPTRNLRIRQSGTGFAQNFVPGRPLASKTPLSPCPAADSVEFPCIPIAGMALRSPAASLPPVPRTSPADRATAPETGPCRSGPAPRWRCRGARRLPARGAGGKVPALPARCSRAPAGRCPGAPPNSDRDTRAPNGGIRRRTTPAKGLAAPLPAMRPVMSCPKNRDTAAPWQSRSLLSDPESPTPHAPGPTGAAGSRHTPPIRFVAKWEMPIGFSRLCAVHGLNAVGSRPWCAACRPFPQVLTLARLRQLGVLVLEPSLFSVREGERSPLRQHQEGSSLRR